MSDLVITMIAWNLLAYKQEKAQCDYVTIHSIFFMNVGAQNIGIVNLYSSQE